ncbi:MAG: hypothetical protein PHO93_00970 [Candidatus Saccharimonadaceae bacterium]|nr:hypothetical protein [Candidatus Saccharimonadaceae bacterium]
MNPEKINNGLEDNSYVNSNFGESDPDLLTNTYGLDDDPRGLGLTGGDAVKYEKNLENGVLDFDDLPMIPEEHELMAPEKPPLPTRIEEIDESKFTDEDWKRVDVIANTRSISNIDAIKVYKGEILKKGRR